MAASAAASAQATPSGLSVLGSPDFDDFGNDDEEEQKPSIEYLDSLNDYRKRSRSREDEGSSGKSKLARTEPTNGFESAAVNGRQEHTETPEDTEMMPADDVETPPEDDPIVYGLSCSPFQVCLLNPSVTVNGKPVPYSKVTEDDHEMMTPDEYTAYFEILQARS